MKNSLSFFVAVFVLPLCLSAQRHHEIGVFTGVSNYYGDLQRKWFPSEGYRPVVGINYKYFMSPRLGFRFGAAYTRISGADSLSDIPVHRTRNLSFGSNIFEVHGGIELNLLGVDFDRAKVSPYVFAGIALFYSNPYTWDSTGSRVFLRPLSTEGQGIPLYPDRKPYNLVNVSFPIGGGLKFFIGKTLMITTEIGFRYTTTDYLDDVSRSYVPLDTLMAYRGKQSVNLAFREDELTGFQERGSPYPKYQDQRGDSKANDWYWFGGLNIAIYFDAFSDFGSYVKSRCPRILGR